MSLRLLLTVRPFGDPRPISERLVGEQRLPQAAAIVGDQSRSNGQNVPRRSIISLEPNDLGAGKVLLEAQDVFDIGAAPGVDRLVVVADAAQIAVGLGDEPEKKILNDVRVLVLVDQDVTEASAEGVENIAVFAQQPQGLEQEIAEVHRVERFQAGLIALVQGRALAAGEPRSLARRHALRIDAPVFPPVDQIGERSRRPALVVQIFRLQELLEQPQLVVGIENGEIRPQAHQLGVHAQNLGADRVERAEPRHRLLRTGEDSNPLAHLPRGLVGEGHRQDLMGAGAAGRNDVRDSGGQDARLAHAGAGENENRPVQRLDRPALLFVQPLEVGGISVVRTSDERGARNRVRRRVRSPVRIFLRVATRIESCAGGRISATRNV